MHKVIVEKQGRITTVIINRPEVRNAVDGETAALLAQAFREFDTDPDADVAILTGTGGYFCAGADLKAVASEVAANRLGPEGDGPMGPSRMRMAPRYEPSSSASTCSTPGSRLAARGTSASRGHSTSWDASIVIRCSNFSGLSPALGSGRGG